MKAYGATQAQIDKQVSKLADAKEESAKPFVIFHDNWPAWEVFRRCINQFKTGAMSGKPYALDYASLNSVIGLFNHPDPLELFDQVRLVEHGYLSNLPDK